MPTQSRPRITAEPRPPARRKSDVRQVRRSGMVPGSLFGHGEPETIQVSARALRDYLRHHAAGALLDLEINGRVAPALLRELERHPVTGEPIALGLQRVDLREKIHATVPIEFVGEEEVIKNGLVLQRQVTELDVQGQADRLPEAITVDVTSAAAGDVVRVGDLTLPDGVEATKDADLPVATISAPKVDADTAAALDAEEAAHAAQQAAHAAEAEEETEAAPAA
ncbi:MAG TPA: 50S ribosomal protein L25 [Armatimonadota bacterium]|nr:50S ribosomal protein L25 [Armatimonadota bacterium]